MYQDIITAITPTLVALAVALVTALSGYVITYVNKKKVALEENTKSSIINKYLDLASETIIECVQATNQTYVDALKKAGAFTAEAQKAAFKQTLDNVMNILSKDAIDYLNAITGDATKYIETKIEATVNEQK